MRREGKEELAKILYFFSIMRVRENKVRSCWICHENAVFQCSFSVLIQYALDCLNTPVGTDNWQASRERQTKKALKSHGTCCDEHWALNAANKSWNTASQTNDVCWLTEHNKISDI